MCAAWWEGLVVACMTCCLLTTGTLCQLVFRDSSATSTVLVGYSTTLRCSARDPTPPENILWFKDGVTVTSDSRFTISYYSSAGNSQLRISSVTYPDAGGYQCIAVAIFKFGRTLWGQR